MCYFFFIHLLSFSFLSFFFFFLAIIVLLYITIDRRVTPCRKRVSIFKILRYCIILRAMSTKNGHKRGHRKLTYYFINFNGKISAVFVTQDSESY